MTDLDPSGPDGVRVRRRCVAYLSGFDPSGPSHYHKLYREQAALQSGVTGDRVEVGPRTRRAEHVAQWTVAFTPAAGGETVQTEVRFWRWDDIIRAHWPRDGWRLAADIARTSALNVANGAAWRMLKLSWPPWIALFAPGALLFAVAVVAPLLALALAWALHRASGSFTLAASALALPVAAAWLGRRLEARLHMQWLMRSFAFTAHQAAGRTPALDERLDGFAAELVDSARDGGFDEILLVGHSSGAIMALSVLARALQRDPALTRRRTQLSLLTLGHCTPMLSSLPRATRFRDELAQVGRAAGVDWVDIAAPPDGCCFALCEPLAAAGLPPAPRADHPKLLSPRFAALFSPARYAEVRRDRFRLHFQYLMASELPGVYDYTAITAGPQTLKQRFASQPSVTDFTQFRRFGR